MIKTADFVAKKYGNHARAQDAYSLQSQQRSPRPRRRACMRQEIVPSCKMKVTDKATGKTHEQEVMLDRDEGPRPDSTLAGLAALKTVEEGAPSRGERVRSFDGAAAVVLMDADTASRRKCRSSGSSRHAALGGRARGESIAIAPRSEGC